MYSELSALLLFTVFVSPAAGGLNWNVAECQKETLKNVKDILLHLMLQRNDIVPLMNFTIVGLEIFDENAVLVIIMVTTSEFYTYSFNLKSSLLEGTRFGASTLEKMKIAAEFYAKILMSSFDEKELAVHRVHLAKEGLTKAIDLWHIETDNKNAVVIEKCAALVAFDDGSFGFAPYICTKTCTKDGVTSSNNDEFLVLGYSQKCESEFVAKQGLHAYLCNDNSYGRIPLLPALYSGAEDLAKVEVDKQTKELSEKLNGKKDKPEDKVKVLGAWSIAKHTLCIAVCQNANWSYFPYFFVVYDSARVGNKILLKSLLHIGSGGKSEFGVMMGLVDYLKPNYLSAEFFKIELNPISPVAELIYAADIAARKQTELLKSEKTPLIGHSFEIANLVSERLENPSSVVCAALLLHSTVIGNLLGSKVNSVLGQIGKAPKPNWPDGVVGSMSFLKMLESPTFPSRTMVEGSVMEAPESMLIQLLRERRKKAYVINNNKDDPPSFTILPHDAFTYDNYFYSMYTLTESTKEKKEFKFRVTITDPYNSNAKVVVSEIYKYLEMDTISYFELNIEQANVFRKTIESIQDKTLTVDSSNGNVAILMRCLEYAARKHVHNRRKDCLKTPYFNHSIGVARVLLHEGCVDDLTLMMAAILHDTLEYTTATKEELKMMFGEQVAKIVVDVAEVADEEEQSVLDKTQRPAVVLVRLADRIYNLRDLDRQCPSEFPEAKRRSQFTSTAGLISRFEFNYTNNLWWERFPKYKDAFVKLLATLKSILESHQNSLKAPVDFTKQVTGLGG